MKYFQAQLNGTIAFPALLHQKASSALQHYKVLLIIIVCNTWKFILKQLVASRHGDYKPIFTSIREKRLAITSPSATTIVKYLVDFMIVKIH